MELRRRKHEPQHPNAKGSLVQIQTPAAAAAVKEEETGGSDPSDYEAKGRLLASDEKPSIRRGCNSDKVTEKKRKADVLQEDAAVTEGGYQEETMDEGQDICSRRRRGNTVNIRCEPKKICEVVRLLNAPQREKVKELGFGSLLDFNMDSSGSRDLIVWLMDHLDPNTMVLDFGGHQKLEITEHAVQRALGLHRGNLDPPLTTEKLNLLPLKKKLCIPEGQKNYEFTYLIQKIQSGGTDRFTMQCFMMIVLAKLLACGSGHYVTPNIWSMVQDIDQFGNMDWCKFTVDYLRYSAVMWKKTGSNTKTVYGCSAFLVIYYLDNLNCKQQMNLVETPRAKFFTKEITETLVKADVLRYENGSPIFGNLNLRIQRGTCYDERTESRRHVPTNMPVLDTSDIAAVFTRPGNQLDDLAVPRKNLCAERKRKSKKQETLDSAQREEEQPEERMQEGEEAPAGDGAQQTPLHKSSEFVNEQTNVVTAQGPTPAPEAPAEVQEPPTMPDVSEDGQDDDRSVPVHSASGVAAEAVQQATTFVNEQMKDFMAGTSDPEILESRLSKLVPLLAQMRALVSSQTRNSELEKKVKELTEKLCDTEDELEAARATMRGTQATINSLTLRASAAFVRLGDTRPVPAPDVASGSLEEAVKLLEDRVSLIEPVSRGHAASLARSSVAFGATALLCREKQGAEGMRNAVAADTRRFLRKQGVEFGVLVSHVVDDVEPQHADALRLQGGRATGTGVTSRQ